MRRLLNKGISRSRLNTSDSRLNTSDSFAVVELPEEQVLNEATMIELQARNKFLEEERLRLLEVSRSGSFRSKSEFMEEASNLLALDLTAKNFSINIRFLKEKESFSEMAGVELTEIENQLMVCEFIRDADGNPGPLEKRGGVAILDMVTTVAGIEVNSHKKLQTVMKKIKTDEFKIEFCRKSAQNLKDSKTLTIPGALERIHFLTKELKFARAEYARLDIGAIECLQNALDDSHRMELRLKQQLHDIELKIKHGDEGKELLAKYSAIDRECRRLYNALIDLKGAIRVFVRVRPVLEGEMEDGNENNAVLHCIDNRKIVLSDIQNDNSEKAYTFDQVFDPSTSQKSVYDEIEPLIQSVVDGYNACVFSYGQTGSGKTYTMDGPSNDRGVFYRAAESLFSAIDERQQCYMDSDKATFSVNVSLVEIYQETLRDLLVSDDEVERKPYSLDIRHHPQKGDVYVEGAKRILVDSPEKLHELVLLAKKNRVVAATQMNEYSSRSHMILIISVMCKVTNNGCVKSKTKSKMQLIDLAGSERASTSGASGEQLREAGYINKSLSALANVMHALQSNDAKHIPFRDSKLTSLLRDSLGGKAKALVLIHVSPLRTHIHQSSCSLEFAQRVGKVRLFGNKTGEKDLSTQMVRFKQENVELRSELIETQKKLHLQKKEADNVRNNGVQKQKEIEHLEYAVEKLKFEAEEQMKSFEVQLQRLKRSAMGSMRKIDEQRSAKTNNDLKSVQRDLSIMTEENLQLRERNTDLRRKQLEASSRLAELEKQNTNRAIRENISRDSSDLRKRLGRGGHLENSQQVGNSEEVITPTKL